MRVLLVDLLRTILIPLLGVWCHVIIAVCAIIVGHFSKFTISGKLGIDPVSYTHLDVYKRQVSMSAWR